MNKRNRLVLAVFLVVLFLGCIGLSSGCSNNGLSTESDALTTESDALSIESDVLTITSDTLATESDALLDENTALSDENTALPKGFVYVTDVVPDVILEIRYYSTYNFLGVRVDDYLAPVAIITKKAAKALNDVNKNLRTQGFAIKIFDTYRPQGAVDHFVRWASDSNDVLTKEYFYPDIAKERIIPDGYIAERSGHSRGSTIDLTIVDLQTGIEVDMGTPFDFFGEKSHHDTDLITEEQKANRKILLDAMEKAGFERYDEEWWHYTLNDEPYPETYFDFPVK